MQRSLITISGYVDAVRSAPSGYTRAGGHLGLADRGCGSAQEGFDSPLVHVVCYRESMRTLIIVLFVGCVDGRDPEQCPLPVVEGDLFACDVKEQSGTPVDLIHTCGPLGDGTVPTRELEANFPGMAVSCAATTIRCIYEEDSAGASQ